MAKKKIYKFSDFILQTLDKKEIYDDGLKTTTPKKLTNQKTKVEEYELIDQFRRYTAFHSLSYLDDDGKYYKVIDNIDHAIDFVDTLKSFLSNRLTVGNIYDDDIFVTEAIKPEKEEAYLLVQFKNFDKALKLNKLHCTRLHTKLSKIIQKCEIEPWEEYKQ